MSQDPISCVIKFNSLFNIHYFIMSLSQCITHLHIFLKAMMSLEIQLMNIYQQQVTKGNLLRFVHFHRVWNVLPPYFSWLYVCVFCFFNSLIFMVASGIKIKLLRNSDVIRNVKTSHVFFTVFNSNPLAKCFRQVLCKNTVSDGLTFRPHSLCETLTNNISVD